MDWTVIIQSALGSFFGGMGVVIICRLFLWGWLGINKVAKVTKPMDGRTCPVPTQMIMDSFISNLNKILRDNDHKVE